MADGASPPYGMTSRRCGPKANRESCPVVNEGLDDDARGESASRAMAGADAAILIPSAKRFMYHLLNFTTE